MLIAYICLMYKFFTILLITIYCLNSTESNAQIRHLTHAVLVDNDTIPDIVLPTYYVVGYVKNRTKSQQRKYNRLVRYVKKVYPYAKLAGQKLQVYDTLLRAAPNEKAKKKLMKQAEDEIRAEYEGKLRKFTINQGKILVKLIDRETSQSSYHLLKELRGSVSAVLWQGVGRIFGYNLKIKYDPEGEDKDIETIVQLIDKGII